MSVHFKQIQFFGTGKYRYFPEMELRPEVRVCRWTRGLNGRAKSASTSARKRATFDILPVTSRVSLVNTRFIAGCNENEDAQQ